MHLFFFKILEKVGRTEDVVFLEEYTNKTVIGHIAKLMETKQTQAASGGYKDTIANELATILKTLKSRCEQDTVS